MPKKLTQEEFIERAVKKHGMKYDYSKTIYKNSMTKVTVTCPIHGDFEVLPERHYGRGDGCPLCRWERAKQSIRKVQGLTTEKFIEKARKVHGDKYDYSKVEYVNNDTPIRIICPEHGEFQQTPHHHLVGSGCQECGKNDLSEKKITDIVKENFENVVSQYKPDFLNVSGKPQSIDIFLPDYSVGIEYQGRQHFTPVPRYGGVKEYEKTIERDERKFNLCKKHGITIYYFTYEKEKEIPKEYFGEIFTDEGSLINEIKAKKIYGDD